MRIAYVDPVSGASGDMLLGALLDAGAGTGLDAVSLSGELAALGLPGWSLHCERVQRAGFAATHAVVHVEDDPPPRTLRQIVALLEASALPAADRARAVSVFRLLGEAEAAVHGAAQGADGADSADDRQLHEVGAVDAIVDIVGTVVGLRMLGVERLYCGPLPVGGGTVRAAHGRLPVPAPAVLEIAARRGLPLAAPRPGEPAVELVTPTGAALLGALATFERPPLTIERAGTGAGTRELPDWPNVLRLWVGESADAATNEGAEGGLTVRAMVLVETDIDDMPAEHVPYLDARLREAGARDVWVSAVQMKKGRPGMRVSAIVEPAAERAVASALLRHSSTLGVRATPLRRYEAPREVLRFESSLGPVAVKVKRLPGEPPRVAPEYEACRVLAEQHGLPLAEVYRVAEAEALERVER